MRLETAVKALKYGHFRQFLALCCRETELEQACKIFPENRKNLVEFQVYFEILGRLPLHFDAIRKEGRCHAGRSHQRR